MIYEIILTDTYTKKAVKFIKKHKDIKEKYIKTLTVLQDNPYHPSLRLHKLQGKQKEYFSISINMSYRIVIDFILEDGVITPIDIGSHDEVY